MIPQSGKLDRGGEKESLKTRSGGFALFSLGFFRKHRSTHCLTTALNSCTSRTNDSFTVAAPSHRAGSMQSLEWAVLPATVAFRVHAPEVLAYIA